MTDSLEKHNIRPLYILDYSNRHYDQGLSPYTDEGRAAFAKWAAAAAVHFKDRGILWEMYNEPNIHFWKPEPKPDDYIKLALETGKAIREAAPNELYIGPATSEIDLDFLEKCFQAGLLEYWDAVSVHPYRQKAPETVIAEYAKLRWLIDKYAPEGKHIPILSAEWGYSSAWGNYNDDTQGKMLPRQWMVNLACDVPISIWYDWHNDGTDPKEPEHHFGTTNFEYHEGRTPVYDPKPSYLAAKTFTETFKGFKYNKRLCLVDSYIYNSEVFICLFDNEEDIRLAAWTTAKEPQTIVIPCSPGDFKAISYLGEELPDLVADENGLIVTVTDGPVYLIPEKPNDILRVAAAWNTLPLAGCLLWENNGAYVQRNIVNPLDRSIRVVMEGYKIEETGAIMRATRRINSASSIIPSGKTQIAPLSALLELNPECKNKVSCEIVVEGHRLVQIIDAIPLNLMDVYFELGEEQEKEIVSGSPFVMKSHIKQKKVMLHFYNPSREALSYRFTLSTDYEFFAQHLDLKQGETKSIDWFAHCEPNGCYRINEIFIMTLKNTHLLTFSPKTIKALDDFTKHDAVSFTDAWQVLPDGDANVGSEQTLELTDEKLAKVTYKFEDGWKFLRLAPKKAMSIEGEPKSMTLRINADGSGNRIRMRFTDSKGQTIQPDGAIMTNEGRQYITFDLSGKDTSHWGGPNDGNISYPIRFDSIIIDGTRKACGPNSVEFASPVVVYDWCPTEPFNRYEIPD